ncbi:hypothetical protein IW15_14055 [Chryseobacterium soli]|uniref:DUF7825 domain-containing protein n=1 Tax=Chryseobacterium soli TaxID=445961 RepID=A0A086A552_9FLAO|nr:DUF6493 family protein [Chryseobacterium soli]KFF11816.1 hypothetical protein IW15_14055 [Chryseobacterium soli]
MLIEGEFKAIYLHDKIKEIILFLEKLIPKEKEKIIVILKNSLKKDRGHNAVSVLATLGCSKNKGTIEHRKVLKFSLNAVNLTFSKNHSRVFFELFTYLIPTVRKIRILVLRAKKQTIPEVEKKYTWNAVLPDDCMKLGLPFQKIYSLFISAELFSKDKPFSGTAFEAFINRAVVADFDLSVFGLLVGEKISFGLAQVKKITSVLSRYINLNPEYNQTFEKLIISILTAIKNPVFNLKKLLELYYELMKLNHSAPDKALIENLKAWEKKIT